MENGALTDEAAAKVTRQVEFYFSDSNLAGDAFLLRSIDENEDGLVSLAVICAFTRMRNHLKINQTTPELIPKDVIAAVAEVLRKSTFLKVSDDGTRVGRVEKMQKPDDVRAEVDSRSLAVSPFPWKTIREDVEGFFQSVAKIRSVRLPRHPVVKAYSGFALVEFESREEAQRVAAAALNFKGADLKFQSKDEFEAVMASLPKLKEREEYVKGMIVSFKLTKPSQEPEKKETDDKNNDEDKEKTEKAADRSDDIAREDIKEVVQQYGNVKFIDYCKGDSEGHLRFESPEEAGKARTAAVISDDGGLIVKDHLVTLEAVEGDAERDYWKKVRDQQLLRKRDNNCQNRYGKDNRGRNNWKQDRKPRGWGGKNNDDAKNSNDNSGGSGAGSGAEQKKKDATPKGKHVIFQDPDDEPEPKQQKTE